MNEGLRSILVGTSGLSIAAVIAVALTIGREITGDVGRIRDTLRIGTVTVVIQGIHFLEELGTGFHERFPQLFDLAPWPFSFFVSFNVFWLVIWIASLPGLTMRLRVALFPLWFLGIACLVNGIAHPLLSIRVGGYFPGLFTSPFVGVVGLLLLRRLVSMTGKASAE